MSRSANHLFERERSAVRILAVLAILLLNLFIVLDAVTYPKHLGLFIGLRLLLTSIICGVIAHQMLSSRDHTTAYVFIMLVPCVFVFAAMSNLSGEGYASDYYIGVIYCMVVMVLFPISTRNLVILQIVMHAAYTFAMQFLFKVPVTWRYFVENHMFMLGIALIVICSHWYISQLRNRIETANRKNESLLMSILPQKVADELKESQRAEPERFPRVCILFSDVVDFTPLAATSTPRELLRILNLLFSRFDLLAASHGCERIKTIGDAYMAACGVPSPAQNCTVAIANLALEMQHVISNFERQDNGREFRLRIGINEGEVVAGIVGSTKFSYDLWGDAVNLASRMESHGVPGKIQVTNTVYQQLRHQFIFEKRGEILVKGVGMVETYFLLGRIA